MNWYGIGYIVGFIWIVVAFITTVGAFCDVDFYYSETWRGDNPRLFDKRWKFLWPNYAIAVLIAKFLLK